MSIGITATVEAEAGGGEGLAGWGQIMKADSTRTSQAMTNHAKVLNE